MSEVVIKCNIIDIFLLSGKDLSQRQHHLYWWLGNHLKCNDCTYSCAQLDSRHNWIGLKDGSWWLEFVWLQGNITIPEGNPCEPIWWQKEGSRPPSEISTISQPFCAKKIEPKELRLQEEETPMVCWQKPSGTVGWLFFFNLSAYFPFSGN